jgi:hypothetical protein
VPDNFLLVFAWLLVIGVVLRLAPWLFGMKVVVSVLI